jgi:electron transfer flavoprotein alpha subunit
MSVLVVMEHAGGKWNRMSFEALASGQKLAGHFGVSVEAAVLGPSVPQGFSGAAQIHLLSHELLARYTPDGFTAALEQLIRAKNPEAVVFPHTYQVRDYAPKLATRFARPLVSDVVDIQASDGQVHFVRQLFQGKLNASVSLSGASLPVASLSDTARPLFVSVQAGAFRAADATGADVTVTPFAVALDAAQIRSQAEEPFRESQRSVDLGAADIIVSVGRGIKDEENIALVAELAQVLHAELAASRPICDNGWLPMERQVGSSGQTVSPKMYLAVGISGAIQHLVGMKGSKTIVAINKDENAPIFESADYGIVGDLFEVVPVLIEELKKVKT